MSLATFTPSGVLNDTYFRLLFEHVGVALVATDQELTIRAWNTAAARMFGAGAERMIGTPLVHVLPHERRHVAEHLLRSAVISGEASDLEFHDRDAQGRTRELIASIAPIVTEGGDRVGASMCIRDITRRIALQNELNHSRKMAALGQMAGAISHHFNNTLGGVITSIDFASASDDPNVKERVLAQTSRALLRVTTLVNGLLAFAEGDQRASDLCDFTELLFELADDLETDITGKGIEFILNVPKMPVLPVPRVQMMTVLHNITENAIEAMPNGGSLRIDASMEKDILRVAIHDSGAGLDENALSRLFEPFYSTKRGAILGSEQAKGLGLAVAHGIVQVLGGSISVSSKLGEGSTFYVAVPKPDAV